MARVTRVLIGICLVIIAMTIIIIIKSLTMHHEYCNIDIEFPRTYGWMDRSWPNQPLDKTRLQYCYGPKSYCIAHNRETAFDSQRLLSCSRLPWTMIQFCRRQAVTKSFATDLYNEMILRTHPDKGIEEDGTASIPIDEGRREFKKRQNSVRYDFDTVLPAIPECKYSAVIIAPLNQLLALLDQFLRSGWALAWTAAIITTILVWYFRHYLVPSLSKLISTVPQYTHSIMQLPYTVLNVLYRKITHLLPSIPNTRSTYIPTSRKHTVLITQTAPERYCMATVRSKEAPWLPPPEGRKRRGAGGYDVVFYTHYGELKGRAEDCEW